EARRSRRPFEVRNTGDLPRRECVASDDGWLLGERDPETARLERTPVELAAVEGATRRHDLNAVAECVLAASVVRQVGLELALLGARQVRQRPVVVAMAVADDERVGVRGIHAEDAVVVEEVELGESEVEQDLAPLPAAQRLEVIGEAVFGK